MKWTNKLLAGFLLVAVAILTGLWVIGFVLLVLWGIVELGFWIYRLTKKEEW